MADDRAKKGPRDGVRIHVGEAYEVTYWTNQLGVTPELLKAAVAKAGPMVTDVARELGK
ncbi:MAG: DUF3606 domain-containing protein [Rhodospirillaceae bacterium]|nr:DUF3606 domain-containing protein [Rhodospirillaceae bacterium]